MIERNPPGTLCAWCNEEIEWPGWRRLIAPELYENKQYHQYCWFPSQGCKCLVSQWGHIEEFSAQCDLQGHWRFAPKKAREAAGRHSVW